MADSYIQDRIREIYAAYRSNDKTKDYEITLTPINGSGDIKAELVIPNRWNDRTTKERVIKETEPLGVLFASDFF